MPDVSSRRSPAAATVVVALALVAVSACGGEAIEEATPTGATGASNPGSPGNSTGPEPTPSGSSESPPPPADEPSTAPPASPPTSAPTSGTTSTTTPTTPPPTSAPPAGGSGLTSALVPAQELPRDPSGRPWSAGADVRGQRVRPTSACQRAPLLSIGATKVVQRRYDNPNPGGVVNTVAAFADDDSARRAYAVLEAWVRNCADTLREKGKDPLSTPDGFDAVAADTSPAGWAVLFYGPVRGDPDSAVIEGQVVVVDDETLSWVVYRSIGQDYNYEPGQAPPERAARVMAQRLAARR